jgi:hypothetical protein
VFVDYIPRHSSEKRIGIVDYCSPQPRFQRCPHTFFVFETNFRETNGIRPRVIRRVREDMVLRVTTNSRQVQNHFGMLDAPAAEEFPVRETCLSRPDSNSLTGEEQP